MSPSAGRFVIGADIGSQGVKAILLDSAGRVVASAGAAYDPRYPAAGWAEEDPGDWEAALAAAVRQVLRNSGVRAADVVSLATGSQVDGLVCVGAKGEALRPAIIWLDRRAAAQCAEIGRRVSPPELFNLTGCNLDASHVAPKILWVRDNEPRIFERTRYFMLPGGYMAYRLTGCACLDYSAASSTLLFDVRRRTWSPELLNLTGLDEGRLGRVCGAVAAAGALTRPAAEMLGLTTGTLVSVGSGDEHAACIGAGIADGEVVCDINGTAESVCMVTPSPVFDASRLLETHCHADPAAGLVENPGFVSGGSYRWFLDTLAPHERAEAAARKISPYEILNHEAGQAPPASDGLVFLPCLSGAMTPTWNADARGVFFGLSLAHGRGHMVRAILEGTAYGLKDNVDRMASIGLNPREIRAVAGGAYGRLWLQIKADVTGLPVTVPREVEATALGAALIAGVTGKLFAGLKEAAGAAVQISHRFEPDAANRRRYDDAYALYREVYGALQGPFRRAAAERGA